MFYMQHDLVQGEIVGVQDLVLVEGLGVHNLGLRVYDLTRSSTATLKS